MEFNIKFKLIIISIITLLITIPSVYANPVLIDTSKTVSAVITYLVVFLITIFGESVIFYAFLRKNIAQYSLINKSIIGINTLTFPITQLVAIFFFMQSLFYLAYIFLIELIPISLECLFFLKIFSILNRNKKIIQNQISDKRVIFTTLLANLFTFLIGFLIQWELYF